jgi:putative inorganic carbon (hco3(-)) transporter
MGVDLPFMKRIFFTTMVLVMVALMPVAASAQARRDDLSVVIQTVPQAPGVTFVLNGKTFVSDSNGLASTSVPGGGTYRLKVVSPKIKVDRRKLTFALWSDGVRRLTRDIDVRSFTYVEVGFDEERPHALRFVEELRGERELRTVDFVRLASADGVMLAPGPNPYRLLARRVVNEGGRLSLRPLTYRVDEVIIDGRSVPLQPVTIKPALSDRTTITLDSPPPKTNAVDVSSDGGFPIPAVGLVVASLLVVGGLLLVLRHRRGEAAGEMSGRGVVSGPTWAMERAQPTGRVESLGERVKARGITALLVGTAAAVSTVAGLSSDSKVGLVLPLVAVAGIGLGLLALTRFVAFVEVLLIARASLDLTKLSGVGPSAGADAGARAQDPASLIGVLFLVAAIFWLLAQRHSNGLPGSPLRRALTVFIAAGILSLLGTPQYGDSVLEVLRILAVVIMFVVLEQLMSDPKRMERLLRAVFLSAVFPLAFTTLGLISGSPRTEVKGDFSRLLGTFNQSNSFARYLMLVLIFGVAIYPHVWRSYKRALVVILPLAAIYLILTYTLSAVIATLLGLVVVALYQSKRLLVGLAVLGLCLLVVFPQLGARFAELGTQAEEASFRPEQSSLQWRLSYWADVFPLAKENPITGIGLGVTSATTESQRQPHNDFLRAYVETGIIGFLAYLSVLISLITLGRRAVRVAPSNSLDRGVAVGFMGCTAAFLAVSLVANVMSNVAILWYFFAFAAAASSVVRRRSGGRGRFREQGDRRDPGDMIPTAVQVLR